VSEPRTGCATDGIEANDDRTPVTTYAWTPTAACEACGEAAAARWRDGEVLVRDSCESW